MAASSSSEKSKNVSSQIENQLLRRRPSFQRKKCKKSKKIQEGMRQREKGTEKVKLAKGGRLHLKARYSSTKSASLVGLILLKIPMIAEQRCTVYTTRHTAKPRQFSQLS